MLSRKKITELSEELASSFRDMAKMHPASGRLQVLMKMELRELLHLHSLQVAKNHLDMSTKARERGDLPTAVWHAGAAKYLAGVKDETDHYNEYVTQLLEEADNGRGKVKRDSTASQGAAEDAGVSVPPGFADEADIPAGRRRGQRPQQT